MSVRIISGSLKGRKISIADLAGLRPTSDRVRETVFNWLQDSICGSRCLDLFAGSGGLSFEAYSRGAARVTCIEKQPKAYRCIKRVSEAWGLKGHFKVYNADAMQWLRRWSGELFDFIFVDPPFQMQFLEQILTLIYKKQCLDSGGLVYIERSVDQKLPVFCQVVKESKTAALFYGLYTFE